MISTIMRHPRLLRTCRSGKLHHPFLNAEGDLLDGNLRLMKHHEWRCWLGERLGSGDGERKTLLTRQIAFQPLPASVLLALCSFGAFDLSGCCIKNIRPPINRIQGKLILIAHSWSKRFLLLIRQSAITH